MKWLLYSAVAALFFLLQGALLQRVEILGVIPFLYPLLAAVPATYEGSIPGTVFATGVGIVCDLLLPGPIPCLHTMIFPLVGLCAALISQSLLPAGFFCSLTAAAAAFLLTDSFHCLILWMQGKAAWEAGAQVMVREFYITAPLTIPVTIAYRRLYRRTHRDD